MIPPYSEEADTSIRTPLHKHTRGLFLTSLRFITSGLALGTERFARGVLRELRNAGYLIHRTEPVQHLSGTWSSCQGPALL